MTGTTQYNQSHFAQPYGQPQPFAQAQSFGQSQPYFDSNQSQPQQYTAQPQPYTVQPQPPHWQQSTYTQPSYNPSYNPTQPVQYGSPPSQPPVQYPPYSQQQAQYNPSSINYELPDPASVGAGGSAVQLSGDKLTNAPVVCRDKLWAMLFLTQLFILIVVGFAMLRKYKDYYNANTTTSKTGSSSSPAWALVAVICALGFSFALLFLWIIKKYAKQLIWISLILSIALSAFALIVAIAARSVVGIVLTALFLAINIWYVYSVRHLIPLASQFVYLAVLSTEAFKGSYAIAIGGLFTSIFYQWLFFACASGIVLALQQPNNPSHKPSSAYGLVYFLLSVSYYWAAFVIKNVVHTTISGVTATWYYCFPQTVPPNPVVNALRRSMTTSFGSICLGSFITAVIRAIRVVIDNLLQQARQQGGAAAEIAICILECILNIIEGMANYINTYAYSHIAIYGKDYCNSAKDAWDLLTSKGWSAVVNDSLIGGALSFAAIVCGLAVGVLAGLIAHFSYSVDWPIYAGFGFIVGLSMCAIIMGVVESAVVTLFICLASDPVILLQNKPALYQRIADPVRQNYGIEMPTTHGQQA